MSIDVNQPLAQQNLVSKVIDWKNDGLNVAMVTLINIEGNAPYPIGSQMAVNETGDFIGQITGGCAEQAIVDQACESLKFGENSTHRYGLNSPYFDIRLPCGSGIDVFIDVMSSKSDYDAILSALNSREKAAQQLETALGTYQKQYFPPYRLIILGQGPIMKSLTDLSRLSGFEVICVGQNRQVVQQLAQFSLTGIDLNEIGNSIIDHSDNYTALVSLFHEHELETDILQDALQTDAFYIGALGSRSTHSRRVELLSERGINSTQLKRIYGPVGLDISANTPSHIAVSILAQIIQQLPVSSHSLLNVSD